MKHPIIYKKTATGATQQWQVERIGDHFRTVSGQVGGKLITSKWTYCLRTNEGRSNERNPVAQCEFEVDALYKKKLDKDYHEKIENIEKAKIFQPMLAKDFNDYKIDVGAEIEKSGSVYCQPKLDGMRCIATKDGLFSRNGKPIKMPHIEETLRPLFDQDPFTVLDGELYNHDYKDDFNSLISAARKQKLNEAAVEIIQYHVYDMPSVENIFSARNAAIEDRLQFVPYVHTVRTDEISSFSELDKLYEEYLGEGYEGQMVRLDVPYANKRTNALLKRKESIDEEFILVDIQEGKGNWAGKAKRAILRLKDGSTSEAGIAAPAEFCARLLADKKKYIGKKTTVRYFGLTPAGKLRFGRCKEFARMDV